MATKGTIAKDSVMKVLQDNFGKDFIGIYDKKGYIWVDDGGTKIQVAISLTCPKNPIGEVSFAGTGDEINFEETTTLGVNEFNPAEFTEEENKKIDSLVEKLNLF